MSQIGNLDPIPKPYFSLFIYIHYVVFKIFLTFDTSNLGYLLNVIDRKGRKIKILENF